MTVLETSPETVAELIRKAIRQENKLGDGKDAVVYHFDEPELANFVLRATPFNGQPRRFSVDNFFQKLNRSSALCPPPNMLGNIRVGQPLLTLDTGEHSISILPRQAGRSLRQWADDLPLSASIFHRTIALLERALQHPSPNPFLDLFDTMYRLSYHGVKMDLEDCNVMLDSQTGAFSFVDPGLPPQAAPTYKAANHTDPIRCSMRGMTGLAVLRNNLRSMLGSVELVGQRGMLDDIPTEQAQRYYRSMDQLDALLEEAHIHTLEKYKDAPPRSIVFEHVAHTQAVPLFTKYSAPAHALAASLRAVEKAAAIGG